MPVVRLWPNVLWVWRIDARYYPRFIRTPREPAQCPLGMLEQMLSSSQLLVVPSGSSLFQPIHNAPCQSWEVKIQWLNSMQAMKKYALHGNLCFWLLKVHRNEFCEWEKGLICGVKNIFNYKLIVIMWTFLLLWFYSKAFN